MDTATPPAETKKPPPRRWPRRLAIGVAVAGAVLGTAYWYLGRETTLQTIAQRVASATGGKITLHGVTGSLYGAMHIDRLVYRTPDQLLTVENIDLVWSPWQVLSSGIAVSKLHAASLRSETLRETGRSPMPASLAPPFPLSVDDARLAKAVFVDKGAQTRIDNIRLRLYGDKRQWQLRDASASTPWGQVAASGTIAASRPYKLDAAASLTQSQAGPRGVAAQLRLSAGGDLESTTVNATGRAGRAEGTAQLVLSPYAAIPLRSLTLHARNIDPGFFNPSLPSADLALAVAARLDANRNITGSVDLTNSGPAGTIDQQRLPLRAMRGQLGGNLSSMAITGVLLDLGEAGSFTGNGSVQRAAGEEGLGTASFVLHTGRLDLRRIHGKLRQTSIAGDLKVTNADNAQAFEARLLEKNMRLDARATLANNVLELREARLVAGTSSVSMAGSASLGQDKTFRLTASASRFNPASFGDLPQADVNATLNASGTLAPAWKVAANFSIRPSRVLGQPLSGKGELHADAAHVSGVDATLALGGNTVALAGSFGAPGERLLWRVDGRQLDALRSGLYGTLAADGALTGTMAAPRTTFDIDARGLGWVPAQRKHNAGRLRAHGEAWLAGQPGSRAVEAKASGAAQGFDPAAFGSPLSGSINAEFDGSGRFGQGWRGALNLALRQSTLSGSPLWGHAKLAADSKHISHADVDLHVGPNLVAARGSFGQGADQLDWRIDAPQLAALGAGFGGVLRGSGTLSGTADAPALVASVDGQDLKLPGKHTLKSLRASASLGSGRGANDPLQSDVQVQDYANGGMRVAALRLQTSGTRGAHALRLAARGDEFDAAAEVRGGWTGNAWNGTVDVLQNRGRYAFALQAPVPLRIATAPGAGIAGLAKPDQVALNGAVIRLPAGSVTVESLAKLGPRWNSRGSAAGVPVEYLGRFSEALGNNVRGDMTLGARWALDLQTPGAARAAPALAGMVHVFRERGDMIVGADVPVPLGLRVLDARADVAGGALRVQVQLDGARAGQARVDATAQLLRGRLEKDSPLRLAANADMRSVAWLAPLAGQPGLELDGSLKLALTGAGTVGSPALDGSVNGDGLAVRWAEQGVRLRNGQLRAVLAGDQLRLDRLYFEGMQGTALADGTLRFSGAEPHMQLRLVANKLEALSRPDRTVVASGEATLVRDANRFALEGSVRAERALIELAPQGRPTMSDDVIVLGRDSREKLQKQEPAQPLMVDLAADLGNEFRLRGMGIDAQLTGSVRLRRTGDKPPRVNGTIRVASGTYAAYGQRLTIERGVLTFSGAYDNPSLNILALRKLPEGELPSETAVEAGVEVRGTALSPSARLVSTPNVPDSDKLSWLVLGHGMQGTSGAEADVLGAAAAALLGRPGTGGGFQSKLASSLGVDELRVSQANTGNGQARGLESTVVTVGKRISSRAYLSFEQGAATATSVVRLRYKLNPRLTLQFQTGTNTALDLLYSWAFD